jgi:hypothetical protein
VSIQVFVNGFSALSYIITYYGLGVHLADVPSEDLVTWLKVSLLSPPAARTLSVPRLRAIG